MADLNSFNFTGRLTQDASIRTLASGTKVLSANVAINTGFGEHKKTLFVKVQQWGERGEKIVQYLTKGTLIACQGEVSRSEWESKEGNKNVDIVVDVPNIQMLSTGNKSNTVTAVIEDDKPDADPVF